MDQRLIERIDRGGGPEACWPYIGCRTEHGYGVLSINNRNRLAHRIVYEIAKGPIPSGKRICHTCDNPPCCNPAHLFAGSAKDNSMDMARKERAPNRKLTVEQVKAIRTDPRPLKVIAAEYGLHFGTVAWARTGRSWTHVEGAVPQKKRAKLTDNQVRSIRKDARTGFKIAAEYGLSYQQVSRIKRRERWAHIPD